MRKCFLFLGAKLGNVLRSLTSVPKPRAARSWAFLAGAGADFRKLIFFVEVLNLAFDIIRNNFELRVGVGARWIGKAKIEPGQNKTGSTTGSNSLCQQI